MTIPQVAIVNTSRDLDDAAVAFIAGACNAQAAECAKKWFTAPQSVSFYTSADFLPASCRVLTIVDSIDPGILGYHDDENGRIYSVVLAQGRDTSITVSHEILEGLIDPTCDQWERMPDGRSVALEICDPVEDDPYSVDTTVLGETRSIQLSNYVLPSWFKAGTEGPWDALGHLRAPLTMLDGGYEIILGQDGKVTNVFASSPTMRLVNRIVSGGAWRGHRRLEAIKRSLARSSRR